MVTVCVAVDFDDEIACVSFEKRSVIRTTCRFLLVVFESLSRILLATDSSGPNKGNNWSGHLFWH